MATTLSTFADSETTMRFNETYLTEGLNRKLYANAAPGIYQGFRLAASGAALSVTVVADPLRTDHVAVYQTATGISLTLRRTGGNFTLNLTPFASKTVVICLFATYSVGAITSAELRGYELAPSDTFTVATENSELVVLGTVTVPASGTISSGGITHDRRRSAWSGAAPEATTWSPLLRNPGFEYGETTVSETFAISDWTNRSDIAVNGSFRLGTTTLHSGTKSLEFVKSSTSASTATILQFQETSITSGQLIRVTGFVRQLIAPIAGSYVLSLNWGDLNSNSASSSTALLSASGVDASFRAIERTIPVPSGGIAVLKSISIDVVGVTSATTGVAVVFDDFQVHVEVASAVQLPGNQNQQLKQERLSAAIVEDPNSLSIGQLAALLRFDRTSPSSEGKLVIERKDQDYSGSNLPPALALLGRLLLGDQLISTEARALLARVTAPVATAAGVDFTLLWESIPAGLKGIRIYAGDIDNTTVTQPGLLITVNARYDGTLWHKDVNATASNSLYLSGALSMFRLYTQATPDTWNSAGWSLRGDFSTIGDWSIGGSLGVAAGATVTGNLGVGGHVDVDFFSFYQYGFRQYSRSGLSFVPISPCAVVYDLSPLCVRNTSAALDVVCDIPEYMGGAENLTGVQIEIVDVVGTTLQAQVLRDGSVVKTSNASAGSGGTQLLTVNGLPDTFFVQTTQLRVVAVSGSATGCEVRRAFVTTGYGP